MGKIVICSKAKIFISFTVSKMILKAQNIDFLFCPLKVADSDIGHALKTQLDNFLADIKNDLFFNPSNIKIQINKQLPAIFNLRLQAQKWRFNGKINLVQILTDEVSVYFGQMLKVKRLSLLAGHILDALELNKKIVLSVEANSPLTSADHNFNIPDISFEQFVDTVYLSNPNGSESVAIVEWTKCSLYIEYIMLAACLINDEKLMVSENKIIELSATLAEAIQGYVSSAADLHLIHEDWNMGNKRKESKGAAIFSKILADKNTIAHHLKSGGELADLKDNFNFAKPVSFTAIFSYS